MTRPAQATARPAADAVHGIRPFSVLRSALGPWRTRRQSWEELGLHSRKGREHTTTFRRGTDPVSLKNHAINDGLSTFDPVLAELSYRWYCPDGGSVLDPFAGGSVRGLVAANAGHPYTGIDLSPSQIDANEATADQWRNRDLLAAEPPWILGDSAEELPQLPAGSFD